MMYSGIVRRPSGPRSVASGLRRSVRLCALVLVVGVLGPASAQELSGAALVEALRGGGYNIYFRHAETDWQRGDHVERTGDWTSCESDRMRQLSDAGRATARRIGDAIRALRIPVGKVLSSEYCRAAETARLMDVGAVETTRDIMNMRAAEFVGGDAAAIHRARRVLAQAPPAGTNVVIVGHGNLMRAATEAYPDEGGSGVFAPRPDNARGFVLTAKLSSADWARLVTLMQTDRRDR